MPKLAEINLMGSGPQRSRKISCSLGVKVAIANLGSTPMFDAIGRGSLCDGPTIAKSKVFNLQVIEQLNLGLSDARPSIRSFKYLASKVTHLPSNFEEM
jgi:hypothetical protein